MKAAFRAAFFFEAGGGRRRSRSRLEHALTNVLEVYGEAFGHRLQRHLRFPSCAFRHVRL